MERRLLAGGIWLLVFVAIVVNFGTTTAQAATGDNVKMEISCTQAPGSCVDLAMVKFKTLVEERSNGRISITLYRAGQLYNPKSEVEAIVKGSLSMAPLHPAFAGARSPALEFIGSLGAQGSWTDLEHYWRFIDLPEIREFVESESKAKLNSKFMSILSGGPGLICNSKRPIHTVEEYKGLKMRAAGSGESFFLKALGMIPINMSAGEVYMALQRGTIDGAATSIGRFFKSKWYEIAAYVTLDNSIPDVTSPLVINRDFWDKLSEADQKILAQSSNEIEKMTRTCTVKEADDSYKKLKEGLVKDLFFMPKTEVKKINKIAQPVMKNLIIERAGKDMGDKLFGLLLSTGE